jgi:hypothetical protein
MHLKTLRGYALQDILTEASRFVNMSEFKLWKGYYII